MRWVVVGAGAAGCVVAGRLAAAGHDVTVVEAGLGGRPPVRQLLRRPGVPGRAVHGPVRARARPRRVGRRQRDAVATPATPASTGRGAGTTSTRRWPGCGSRGAGRRTLGPVDRALLAAAPTPRRPLLTVRDGRRVTAADAYLRDVDVDDAAAASRRGASCSTATGPSASRLADGTTVAGRRRGASPPARSARRRCCAPASTSASAPLRNHAGLAVTLRLRPDVASTRTAWSTGPCCARDGVEVTAINHLGPGRARSRRCCSPSSSSPGAARRRRGRSSTSCSADRRAFAAIVERRPSSATAAGRRAPPHVDAADGRGRRRRRARRRPGERPRRRRLGLPRRAAVGHRTCRRWCSPSGSSARARRARRSWQSGRMGANGACTTRVTGCLAYVQRDGSWGWSNAGLVVGDGASLLVDTLFDLPLHRRDARRVRRPHGERRRSATSSTPTPTATTATATSSSPAPRSSPRRRRPRRWPRSRRRCSAG